MTKRDILTPIGITLGFIMIMLSILSKGGREEAITFLDFSSIFIVIGGLTASLMITFKREKMRLGIKVIKGAFHKNDEQLTELIQLFVHLSERARREEILALENELEEVKNPFIKKGVLLAVDGIEPEVIQDILNAEITAMEERHY